MRNAIWNGDVASEIIAVHAGEPGALLPILHAIQKIFGHIPEPAIPLVAATLNLSRAEVHGVVSFYQDFRSHPAGLHVLKLCRAEACQSMGGDALARGVIEHLGVDWGGTTTDGALTVEPVFCLGLCASAPAALFDERPVGRLTSSRLESLVERCSA